MAEGKTIKITCSGADFLPINTLIEFQGNLKSLTDKEYQKLKSAFEKYGFSFPIFIWRDEKKNFIIDGHHRLSVLKKMIEEGWKIKDNKIPVAYIEAKNKKEAKEKLLLAASQYAKIDMESLYEFLNIEELNFTELKSVIDLPNINLDYFQIGYLGEIDPNDPNKEWAGMPEFESLEKPFRSINIHFKDQKSIDKFANLLKQKITDQTKYLWYPFKPKDKLNDKEIEIEKQ